MPRHRRSIDLLVVIPATSFLPQTNLKPSEAGSNLEGMKQASAGEQILFKTISGRRSCTEVLRDAQRKYWTKSETGLADAGDLALISQLTEADTADAVVAQVSVGAAADLAAIVLTSRELCRSLLLENHRFLCHYCTPP